MALQAEQPVGQRVIPFLLKQGNGKEFSLGL